MALHDSKETYFSILDTSAVKQDMSAYVVSVNGLPGPRELNDATTLGDSSRVWHPTLQNAVITLEVLWDETTDTGPDDVFGDLREHTAATAFEYGPRGNTATYEKYSGSCWVRIYDIATRVGSLVTARVEMPCNTVVARGSFP
ncbi:MAG: hypothetical protein KAJ19_07240 [Gammaproteobacteria bacterium]|nr:hypothetical protein [Gammaproteobacteria bacterium]